MKKLLYGLLVLFVAGVAIANPGNLGVFRTKDRIGFPVYSLDTLTGQWRRPDSVYLHIFYGRLANLPSFTTRVASDFVAASWLDSMKISSMTNPIYTFHDSVGRIDADSGNGAYWGLLQTFFQTKTTDFSFEFTISDSSFTKAINKAASDSFIVDRSTLALVPGNFTPSYATTAQLGDSVRKGIGDTVATFTNSHALTDSMRLVAHDSGRVIVQPIKDTANAILDTLQNHDADWGGGAATADVYPLTGIKFVVDAVGLDANSQFVTDTAALGVYSSNQATLVNRAVIIRSLTDGEVQIPTTITRVAYTGANCSLTVNIDAPKNFAANDTIQLTGLPWHDFATLAEATDSSASAILDADTSDHINPGSVGESIARGGTGSSDFDSTQFLQVMFDHGWYAALDSLVIRVKRGLSNSLTLAGDLYTQSQFEAFSFKHVERVDSVTYTDTLGSQVSGGGGGGSDYAGSGAYACTLYVFDGATAVNRAVVNVYNSDETARTERGNTDPNGRIIFNLDAATYHVRMRYGGATQNTNPQSVVVTSAGANDTIQINIVDPTLCSVSGTLRYRDGEPIAGALVYAFFESALDTIGYDGAEYIGDIQPVRTNANGDWAISLTPNVLLDANSKYIIRYVKQGVAGLPKERKIVVPNQGTADISDL